MGRRKQSMKIFIGGLRVADLKLNRLPFLDDITDDDGARLLVRSDEVADEEIPAGKLCPLFIHCNADMQGSLRQRALIGAELSEDRLQTVQCRDSPQFLNNVVLRFGHDEPVTDRATALRDDGANRDVPRQGHADQAVGVDFAVEEETIFAEVLPTP